MYIYSSLYDRVFLFILVCIYIYIYIYIYIHIYTRVVSVKAYLPSGFIQCQIDPPRRTVVVLF